MNIWLVAVILTVIGINLARAQPKIPVDRVTIDYLQAELNLWQKIDVQQILIDRGNLLNEIYREHNRTLQNDIADAKTIISLSDNGKFRQLFDTVRAIETHTANVKESLEKGDNARVARLLKHSMTEIEQLSETILQAVNDNSFWMNILTNVRH